MASLRDIRRRIKSVKNTAQITKAMQMVAASKMRKAQDLATQGRDYAEGLSRVLAQVNHRIDEDFAHPLYAEREVKNPCVVVLSTNKGLCGGLNTNLFREMIKLPENTKFITIGRKGRQALARLQRDLVADFELSENVNFKESKTISKYLIEQFLEEKIDSVQVLYPAFVNTLVQRPTLAKILPMGSIEDVSAGLLKPEGGEAEVDTREFLFEPDVESVLTELFPAFVHFQLYHLILEARASEHSARMVAMKSATDNAKQLVKDLTLEYNKARQAAITNEILEIAAAQAAE